MDLIKKMMSIPAEPSLTATQRFTFLTAFVAYCIAGLSMTLAPDLWNTVLHLDFTGDARGYFILVGSGLVAIGLCYMTLSRNRSSQIPNHGPLLGTVLSRLMLVNAVLAIFYIEGIINERFALIICVLDSTLASLTYVIWSQGNEKASWTQFLREIWSVVNPCFQKAPPYKLFQVLGFVQSVLSLVASSILIFIGIISSRIEGSHTEGMLRSYFVTLAVHGILHVLAAGSQNNSFPIASVFYRMMWNIPILFLLEYTSQIPTGLANILILYDVIFSVVTIALFAREHRVKAN